MQILLINLILKLILEKELKTEIILFPEINLQDKFYLKFFLICNIMLKNNSQNSALYMSHMTVHKNIGDL